MKTPSRSGLLLCLPLLLAGCGSAGRPAGSDGTANKYVMETGSNLPRKVKKGEASDGSLNIEKGDSRTLETLQRDQTVHNMKRDGA